MFRAPVQLFTSAITPLDDVLKHHGFWDHITDNPDSTFITLERYLDGILQRDLSYAAGYYDQSHLIKSCYYFTGYSPGSYLQCNPQISEMFAGL